MTMMLAFGMLAGLPALKWMGMSDPLASFVGLFSQMLYYFFLGYAIAPWMMWLAGAVGFLCTTPYSVARYVRSK